MKRTIQVSFVTAALVGAFSLLTPSIAQPVDIPSPYGPPVEVGAPEIIAHRINPNVVGAQPPAGSTSATSPILYHTGGTVLPTPTVYLIWYGNWAQGNGLIMLPARRSSGTSSKASVVPLILTSTPAIPSLASPSTAVWSLEVKRRITIPRGSG